MTHEPQPSRHPTISQSAQQMLALGESGRYEFKRDTDAVSVGLLAALANWVAADPEREVAHLLVGVEEVEDRDTGLVYGTPSGLPKGLDKAVARIQDLASKTRPIPIDIFIVEEAVATEAPFVRAEIRPTMPPHFDDQGRRQTRQGRSTRALSDEELLRIYLDREAGSFAVRFRQVSEELHSAVGAVGGQVDQIAEGIEKHIAVPITELTNTTHEAADAAGAAFSSVDMLSSEVGQVQRLVRNLQGVVQNIQDDSAENLANQITQVRRQVWWHFTVDTFEHISKRAERLEDLLRELLSSELSLDINRNIWELRVWQDLLEDRLEQRGGRGTQKWWSEALREVVTFMKSPAYAAPELPDLRSLLKADLDHELDNPESITGQFLNLLQDP